MWERKSEHFLTEDLSLQKDCDHSGQRDPNFAWTSVFEERSVKGKQCIHGMSWLVSVYAE